MKRIVLFSLLLIFAATSTLAQEVQLPYPSTTALSYEKNKIYYEGNHISKRDCQAFLLFNADEDIYNQFRKGRQMYSTGWGLLGTGLALDAFALGFTLGICLPFEQDPERPTMGPMLAVMLVSIPVGAGGLAFTITGIPLVCVGQKRMQQSIEAYNVSLPEPQTAKNYWSIQPSSNGIGLAYHF